MAACGMLWRSALLISPIGSRLKLRTYTASTADARSTIALAVFSSCVVFCTLAFLLLSDACRGMKATAMAAQVVLALLSGRIFCACYVLPACGDFFLPCQLDGAYLVLPTEYQASGVQGGGPCQGMVRTKLGPYLLRVLLTLLYAQLLYQLGENVIFCF